jgi:lipopolysaccharide export system protein LptC
MARPMAGNPARGTATDGAGRRRVQAYSRIVAWMKVVLPLAAIAVISALYFASQKESDLTEIFTAEELLTLGSGMRLENPRFVGVTEQGEPFAIRAEWALPDSAMPRFIDLERPEGEIETSAGRTIAVQSETGRMHREEKVLVLKGVVVMDTSDGYHVETDEVEIDLEANTAVGPGPVRGTGPSGEIEAGSFRADAAPENAEGEAGGGTIWFENGVRLVFIPSSGSGKDSE